MISPSRVGFPNDNACREWNAVKITIPAVKILGTAPSLPINDDLAPEPCLSQLALDHSLFSPLEEDDDIVAAILPNNDDDEHTELGEFLLDAVDWL